MQERRNINYTKDTSITDFFTNLYKDDLILKEDIICDPSDPNSAVFVQKGTLAELMFISHKSFCVDPNEEKIYVNFVESGWMDSYTPEELVKTFVIAI